MDISELRLKALELAIHSKDDGDSFLTIRRAEAYLAFLSAKESFKPIADFGLSTRTFNALRNDGILTASEVRSKSDSYLLGIPNFGRHSLNELREKGLRP